MDQELYTYSEPVTSHAHGGLAGSRQTQQRADIISAILKLWHHIRNPINWCL